MAITVVALSSFYWSVKMRKRKPFNPMLGETYELVTDKFRLICEKVMHTPKQIVTFELEGANYLVKGFNRPLPKFRLNGGRGMMEIAQGGTFDIYFKKYDEWISVAKPKILAKNLIIGSLYIELEGQGLAVSNKGAHTFKFGFHPKSSGKQSSVSGVALDQHGVEKFKMSGSYLDQIKLKDLSSGEEELVWSEPELVPEAHLQYFYN
mmetsp:Transcript_8283/g.13853  ORF Transcript_8283/g.13853 Transcript_8283/m.13853 type:complete len:207 (+) Transcript_8283:2072-2692(+)